MKICLIGGIYGQRGERTGYLQVTPETTLEAGLRSQGHDVTTLGHYDEADFSVFDIVHVHHLSYGAVRVAADRSGAGFVYTAHDVSQMAGANVSLVRRLASRYVISRADGVVTLSDGEAAYQRSAYPVAGALQRTIPNGVDHQLFSCRRGNRRSERRPWHLLFVGQLIPLKNVDLILRTLPQLAAHVELSLVYQNSQLESELRQLAASLGIADRVHFLGRRNPEQLAELYQKADLLLLPSDTEALPSVITEAMLSGLPFVASAVGGIPEQAGPFGTLLAERSERHLASAISDALGRYSELEALSGEMSHYARDRFSIAAMISKHLELYREIAGRRPRRLSGFAPVDAFSRAAVARFGVRSRNLQTPVAPAVRP